MNASVGRATGFLALSLLLSHSVFSQTEAEIKAKFTHGIQTYEGVTVKYRLFSPDSASETELYPLILALHGGWGGTDNENQLTWRSATSWADSVNQNRHPAFVVAPRAPENTTLFHVHVLAVVVNILDTLQATLPVDLDRIYVTGYSNGGIATFRLLEDHPDRFAAAVPMSGWGDLRDVPSYAHVPIWAFHGRQDDVIPPDLTRQIFQRLADLGLQPVYTHCGPDGSCEPVDECALEGHLRYRRHLYTEFKNEGHAMWLLAYNDPRMIDWTFSQRRRTPEQRYPMFEVPFEVDMTFELEPDATRHVGVLGDRFPLSGDDRFPVCDPDGDGIYSADIAFESPLTGTTITYRFSHADPEGSDVQTENLASPRSQVLSEAWPPIVFWNDENAVAPSRPLILSPSDGATVVDEADLAWAPGMIGGRFDVNVSSDADYRGAVVDSVQTRARSLSVDGLDSLVTYYWRVRAVNAEGPGEWAQATFKTVGGSPSLIEPLDGSVQLPDVLLRWSRYPGATRYYLQLAEDEGFEGVSTIRTLTPEYQAHGLTAGVTYYWRAGANAARYMSATWSFEVSGTTGSRKEDTVPHEFELHQNHPNPFNPSTTIEYDVPYAEHVTLTVFDLLGRRVRVLDTGTKTAGKHGATFSADGLPTGVYLYRLEAGSFSDTRVAMLLR